MNPTHPGPAVPDDRHDDPYPIPHAGGGTARPEAPYYPVPDPLLIAVWAETCDDPATAQVFTPDGYACWAEMNRIADVYPAPTGFYTVTDDGGLTGLRLAVEVDPYDHNDLAQVVYTFTRHGEPHPFTAAVAFRDGRA